MNYLIPPLNFGMVEDDLYRSGEPNVLTFPFLETLHLRTVVYLHPSKPHADFLSFVDEQQIKLIHLGAEESHRNPWNMLSEGVVIEALKYILQPEYYPLLLCCRAGRHRTGTVAGCLRKLQRWNLTSIFEEYRRYADSKVSLLNEQFIELFDTDLVSVPTKCPVLRL
jgi:tyrosine-protein phosphatase OCA1